MNINPQPLSTLAELAMVAGVPNATAARLHLAPDYVAAHGRIRLFLPARFLELTAALAARRGVRGARC